MSAISDKIRTNFGRTAAQRDAGLTTPHAVARWDVRSYGDDPVWQVLDVYRPKQAEDRPLPVIVSVHGGGWVYGDKERYQFYCMDLAERGFAVVNFNYRLAPEHKFPAPLEDTCLVFQWVRDHAAAYGFDLDHVFAVGDSAGGHTLGLYCALCANPDYAARFTFTPNRPLKPEAIALNCGIYTVSVSDRPEDQFSTSLMADYLEHKGTAEELQLVNLPGWLNQAFPPAFIMTAEQDFLKFQVPGLAARMLECNIPFRVQFYTDPQEELEHVFHLDIRKAAARRCSDEECAWFASCVHNEEESK